MRVRCCLALLLASSALAAAAAAAAPVTSGCTTDAAVLASIPEQSESAIAYPAAIPGPSTSRTLPDGTLIAGRVGSTTAAAAAAGVAPQKAAAAGSIGNNQCIKTSGTTNACRASPNGRFRLCMQADSNVVLYDNGRAYWASNTQGKSTSKPMRLCVQADNNVVAYDARNRVVWASNTCCNATRAPVTLFMQDDGNVVLVRATAAMLAVTAACCTSNQHMTLCLQWLQYDKGCNPLWNTGTLRAPALAPPCRGGGRDRLPLAASATTGPFGGGDADGGGAFDDTGLDSQPITRIDVRAGSWIDALRVSYGGTPTPWRGGRGGGERPSLVLAADEFITRASVRAGARRQFMHACMHQCMAVDRERWPAAACSRHTQPCLPAHCCLPLCCAPGGFVEEIRFTTNKGRTWSTSGDTSGDPGLLASPCPQGAYRCSAAQQGTSCVRGDASAHACSRRAHAPRCATTLATGSLRSRALAKTFSSASSLCGKPCLVPRAHCAAVQRRGRACQGCLTRCAAPATAQTSRSACRATARRASRRLTAGACGSARTTSSRLPARAAGRTAARTQPTGARARAEPSVRFRVDCMHVLLPLSACTRRSRRAPHSQSAMRCMHHCIMRRPAFAACTDPRAVPQRGGV